MKLAERIKSFIEDEKPKESFELIQGEIIRIAGEETNDELLKITLAISPCWMPKQIVLMAMLYSQLSEGL
ncbi:MAG: hypothetical protein IPL42_01345 [Saprospiraceae bacterium]|nr:hypothetical protein [Saprospiraceae bacterium]